MRVVKLFLISTAFGALSMAGPARAQSTSASSHASSSAPPASAASSARGPGAHGAAAKPVMVRMMIPGFERSASAPSIPPLNARPGKSEAKGQEAVASQPH